MQQLELTAETDLQAPTREPQQASFHVFDGHTLIVVEAMSETDARYLCAEMAWEFVCVCD